MITEAEAQVFLFSHVDVWQKCQRELLPILISDLEIAESIVIFKSSTIDTTVFTTTQFNNHVSMVEQILI